MEYDENILEDQTEDPAEEYLEDQTEDQADDQAEDQLDDQSEDQDEEEDFDYGENVFMEDGENLIYENENSRSTSLYSQSSTVSDGSGSQQTVTVPDDFYTNVEIALYFESFTLSLIIGILIFLLFSNGLKK